MRRELAIEFSRVTEAAALAGYKWLGRGDKNIADGAAFGLIAWRTRSFVYPWLIHWFIVTFTLLVAVGWI